MYKYFLFCLLFVFGCSKVSEEIDMTGYDAEFAIPIIKDGSISFLDLWQNNSPGQSLIVSPDGGLVFKYESTPAEVTTKDILGNLDFPIISGLADTVSVLPFQLPANLIIEQAVIASGTLFFQFQPIGDKVTEITFTLPHIKLNGQPLVIETNGYSGSTVPIDLTGYTFEPEGNFLEIKYSAKDVEGNSFLLQNAGIISRPILKFVKGAWGREEFQLPTNRITIDLYDERFLNGNLRFTEPTITANIESSFGLPIRSRVDIMSGVTKKGGKMLIDASAIDGIDINYPRLEERGIRKQTVLQVDYTNSNIVEVFDAQLTELEYGLTAIANPTNDQNLTVFIEDTSTFKAEVIVEVPVVGSTTGFEATEQFALSFDEVDAIAEGEFKLIVENELPIAAQLQIYFLKGETFIIDSLFQTVPQLVESAITDKGGNVTSTAETTTFIPVSASQMQNIIAADELQVKAIFQTAENGTREVIIKAEQQLKFRMGLKFKTK